MWRCVPAFCSRNSNARVCTLGTKSRAVGYLGSVCLRELVCERVACGAGEVACFAPIGPIRAGTLHGHFH